VHEMKKTMKKIRMKKEIMKKIKRNEIAKNLKIQNEISKLCIINENEEVDDEYQITLKNMKKHMNGHMSND